MPPVRPGQPNWRGTCTGSSAIVPGLSDTQRDVPDVMRGEEVQILGALRMQGLRDAQV